MSGFQRRHLYEGEKYLLPPPGIELRFRIHSARTIDIIRVSAELSRHNEAICCESKLNLPVQDLFIVDSLKLKTKKINSVALVRELTIPTERSPLVSKVSAYFNLI
jgi:hypothetical protein